MRQLLPRFFVAGGLIFYGACATAIEEGNLGGELNEDGGSSTGGTLAASGSGNPGPGPGTGGAAPIGNGGKAGMPTTGAFGGTSTSGGGTLNGTAGSASGGTGGSSSAGSGSGGKAGSSTGGSGTAGTGTSGSTSGGSGSAGSPGSTVCDGVPDWTDKTYKIGDTVAHSCAAPFNGTCPVGQSHKFECNPVAGAQALPWCQQRPPGTGNGWAEAWVDKGQCQ